MTGFVCKALAAALIALCAVGAANAQQQSQAFPFPFDMRGTPQEEAACAPDSARFCRQFEPNPLLVLSCLQRHRPQISRACQTVLRNRGV